MDKERTGVGEYTAGLLNALFEIDKQNQFFLFYNSRKNVTQNIPQWRQENVHYVGTRWPNKLLNFFVWLKIIKIDRLLIYKYKIEIKKLRNKEISQFPNFPISQLDVWLSPNLNFTHLSKHLKHIQTIHDLSFEFFPEFFTLKQRLWHWLLNPGRQCRDAKVILVPSESTRRDVTISYKVESYKVIKLRPGVSNLGHNDIGHKTEEKYILYLGTLEPRKNVESVILAYQQYSISSIQYSLVIAGGKGWKNKKLLQLINSTPGVKYLGYVNEAEKNALFKNASLFVFPSFYEGFGLPVLEAMASGVPVITSNRSSLPEVVDDAAYLVNPHNISEITDGIKLLLANDNLRQLMGERGKRRVESFNWKDSAEKLMSVINSLK